MKEALYNLSSFAFSLIILHLLVGLTVPVVVGSAVGIILFNSLSK